MRRRVQKPRKIAVFNLDGTLYNGHLFLPLVRRQGLEKTILTTQQSEIESTYHDYMEQKCTYEQFIIDTLVLWAAALKQVPVSVVHQQVSAVLNQELVHFHRDVFSVFQKLWADYDTYLVTHEPQFVAQPVTKAVGATGYVSTQFSEMSGVYTGKIDRTLVRQYEREEVMVPFFEMHDRSGSIGVGSTEKDIRMLTQVEHPICVLPSAELRDAAQRYSWTIISPNELGITMQRILR